MKKIYYFIALACMMAFTSCSSDVDEFVAERNSVVSNGELTVGIGMPGADDTRVSTADITNMVWEEGDQIIAEGFSDAEGYTSLGTSVLTLQSKPNSNYGVFKGAAVEGAVSYKYTYSGSLYQLNQWGYYSMDYKGQVQNGANSLHMKESLWLKSSAVAANATGKVVLSPMNPILKINVKSLPAAFKDANDITFRFYYNNGGESHLATLNYKGTIEAGDNYLYMAVPAFTLENQWNSIKFEIQTGESVATASVDATGHIYHAPGKIYTVTIDYDNAGSWNWVLPSKTVFAPKFTPGTDVDWTQETTPDSLKNLYKFISTQNMNTYNYENTLEFNAEDTLRSEKCPVIESRIISPEFSLNENNELDFTFKIWNMPNNDVNLMQERFKASIRTKNADGTWGAWTDLNITYPQGFGWEGVNALPIPAEFNNKVVQLSFFVHSEMFKGVYSWNNVEYTRYGVKYYITNLKIVSR